MIYKFIRVKNSRYSKIIYDINNDLSVRKFSKKCIVIYTLPRGNQNDSRIDTHKDNFDKRLEDWIKDNTIENSNKILSSYNACVFCVD